VVIEIRHADAACSACGAGSLVSAADRPEFVPVPVDGDADLAAEMAGIEAEMRGYSNSRRRRTGLPVRAARRGLPPRWTRSSSR
jgi:hypothetical protein